MFSILKKLFGDPNEKEIKRLTEAYLTKINSWESTMETLSNDELRSKTSEYKERIVKGETLEQLLPEAFATVREAGKRVLGQRIFDVQFLGGINLHLGNISEMRTGEGKTLAAVPPAYLNSLLGEGVHIVTVNDYLARSQGEWMGQVYRFLGLSVGIIIHDQTPEVRQRAYNSDVTYGTNNEFGFDYLRDNMVGRKEDMVQRPLSFAIVDEVDSILIDEARTPLIISGQGEESTDLYQKFAQIAQRLQQGYIDKDEEDNEAVQGDFTVDEKAKSVSPTENCVRKVEQILGVDNLMAPEHSDLYHHLVIALRAKALMKRDVDYVLRGDPGEEEVVIVDEFTGRLMFGRRYSDGLHQAIEAKEGVKVARESQTLATITLQNYFRMYKKLSGMTGTALTEEGEFKAIYGMSVLVVPTNKPMIRNDLSDLVYRNEQSKFQAVVEEIVQRHASGQPMLVGTISVEKSEYLSALLHRRGVKHQVLNAKYHEQEADIVAQAGRSGMVTIATNMAGRGTDIILGGNPDYLARGILRKAGYDDEQIYQATSLLETDDETILKIRQLYIDELTQFTLSSKADASKVVELGGLHIIGTERHESRRIDNQLRGRAGRQGDPGSSQFFISLEDDLMRLFGTDRVGDIMQRIGMDDDRPIENSLLTSAIENAQKKVEGRNFDRRKQVLDYDDVMNQQRGIIYEQRRQVLEGQDLRKVVLEDMIYNVIEEQIERFCDASLRPEEWDPQTLHRALENIMPLPNETQVDLEQLWAKQNLEEYRGFYQQLAHQAYLSREESFGNDLMREIERAVTLRAVDIKWMQHIDDMQELREGIGLRAYAQKDPLQEYKIEAFEMFEAMIASIREEIARLIFRVQVNVSMPVLRQPVAKITSTSEVSQEPRVKKQSIETSSEAAASLARLRTPVARPVSSPSDGSIRNQPVRNPLRQERKKKQEEERQQKRRKK